MAEDRNGMEGMGGSIGRWMDGGELGESSISA